jgi:hypothetical protein
MLVGECGKYRTAGVGTQAAHILAPGQTGEPMTT